MGGQRNLNEGDDVEAKRFAAEVGVIAGNHLLLLQPHPPPRALRGRQAGDIGELLVGEAAVLPGDITDAAHRKHLINVATATGPLDLIVNNASDLGGSPLPQLRHLDAAVYQNLLRTNVLAPQQLIRAAIDGLAADAVIINVSSDAGVEHYGTWGGYGSTKAALDHQTLTWAAEEPQFTWYAVDPGDLRTAMHQAAFPGEDISDRPEPESVAPVLVALVGSGLPSGRYRASDLRHLVETSAA